MHGGFSTYKAKFEALLSAHYVAAVYLRDRTVTLDQFESACYDDPSLRAFAAERVEISHDPSLSGGQCVAEVETKNDGHFTARCEYPLGAPENPVTRQQIEDKFRTYAQTRLPSSQVEGVIEAVNEIEKLESAETLIKLLQQP
jgi:2-methylcitrate dehydratase PrpD